MKNLLLILSLAMNIMAVLIACSKNEQANSPNVSTSTRNEQTMREAGSNTVSQYRSAPPSMPYATIAQMIGNYRSNQLSAINGTLGMSDAYAACFDLDSIENFIDHLRQRASASGCTLLNKLGIRFYYAAYSTPAEGGVPYSYSRKHTLVMIPAYKSSYGYYVDFDPLRIDSVTCVPSPIGRSSGGTIPQGVTGIQSLSGSGQTYAMDHPMLSPPPVQGMAF